MRPLRSPPSSWRPSTRPASPSSPVASRKTTTPPRSRASGTGTCCGPWRSTVPTGPSLRASGGPGTLRRRLSPKPETPTERTCDLSPGCPRGRPPAAATDPLAGRRILVLISGSIAAVKLPLVVSALVQRGAQVRCVLSPSAAQLVSPSALACLSRQPCHLDADQWSAQAPRPCMWSWRMGRTGAAGPPQCHDPGPLGPRPRRHPAGEHPAGL